MPKWSEVPWGTVITGLVATYGAVLSTAALVGQRRRDRLAEKDARRHQAEQVSGWLVEDDGPSAPSDRLFAGLVLQNFSNQLVYYLIAGVVTLQGGGPRTAVGDPRPHAFRSPVGRLPPGETKTRIEHPGSGMYLRVGVELAFQDAAGRYWLRRGDGLLEEVDQSPFELYGIPEPIPWEHP